MVLKRDESESNLTFAYHFHLSVIERTRITKEFQDFKLTDFSYRFDSFQRLRFRRFTERQHSF